MAKKKEEQLSYLQMPLPSGRKSYKMTKRSWSGLNYRQTIDTGALSMEKNISTSEAPYLVPSERHIQITEGQYPNPISMFAFDEFLLVIYRNDTAIKVDYITFDDDGDIKNTYTGTLKEKDATDDDEYPRCVVQFNKYVESDDIVNGEYTKRLLIFPDKKSMYFYEDDLLNDKENKTNDDFALYEMDVVIKKYYNDVPKKDKDGNVIEPKEYPPPDTANHNYYYQNTYKCKETLDGTAIYKYCQYETEDKEGNKDGGTEYGWKISMPPTFPSIKFAAVHLSRLFGVSDDSVYASGFNDYANWNLDSIDEYNESNAWCSKAQSNTKADGNFTGIINFQGHIVCFKRDYMHEIYNTKNPFRIQDIYAEGAIDHRTIQDVDGKLIFVSDDDVKIYTGSNPRIIGYYLNMKQYVYAVSGTDGRNYYLYCEDAEGDNRLFVYDTIVEQWSEQNIYGDRVLSFAHNKQGMFMLCNDGFIYKMNTQDYKHTWSFETDLFTNQTIDIKHIKKMQMFADIPEEVNDGPNADVNGNNANIKIYFLYDDEIFDKNTSHLVYSSDRYGQQAIRVKPRQTVNYGIKVHIEGSGYVRLYEMELLIESGGDLYV